MSLFNFNRQYDFCPVCKNKLDTFFNSKSNKIERFDKFVKFTIKFNYSRNTAEIKVNENTGDFHIEFFDISNKQMNIISVKLVHVFKSYIGRLMDNECKIYKFCKCRRYTAHSYNIVFDFKLNKINDVNIMFEFLGLDKEYKKGIKSIYRVYNHYSKKQTNVTYLEIDSYDYNKNFWEADNVNNIFGKSNLSEFNFPILDWSDLDKTLNKINNLILFT